MYVQPHESKPLDRNMQSFIMYIQSKGAYKQKNRVQSISKPKHINKEALDSTI